MKLVVPGEGDPDENYDAQADGYNRSPRLPSAKRIKVEADDDTSTGWYQAPVLPPRFSTGLPNFSRSSTSTPPLGNSTLPLSLPHRTRSSTPQIINSPANINPQATEPPPAPMIPNPLAPVPFLPLFNQMAAKRKLSLEYQMSFQGPPHLGKWHAVCHGESPWLAIFVHSSSYLVVSGICKGEGSGNNKQIAKEEAAKQAYYAMGWAPSEFTSCSSLR